MAVGRKQLSVRPRDSPAAIDFERHAGGPRWVRLGGLIVEVFPRVGPGRHAVAGEDKLVEGALHSMRQHQRPHGRLDASDLAGSGAGSQRASRATDRARTY